MNGRARLGTATGVIVLAMVQAALSQSEPDTAAPWLSGVTLDKLEATRLHPLFSPLRQPPVIDEPVVETAPVVASISEASASPPEMKLVGIISASGKRQALLQDPASGQIHRLKSGDRLQNWVVSIVDNRTVQLEKNGQHQDYRMFAPTQ
ncbi:hypothetical protein [Rhizobium sp. BK068]|uniref:hypothetical protein n=1 Tax=unclassified Rhizobium TaxID=2613769 RepID=UPI00104EF956|nr:hypothetical protein [Rhizobium sp. BK068]MBB3396514.1 hypothetical protein [Rhizobium sp. BK060]MBB4170260.1 hypothetical protein [Rhizobium sp. BK538]TCM76248.1 hypothetical protein EV291_11041 [Rhizobium sp. BK068]